jgi:HD superfamily phosphohydrolase
MAKNVHEIRDPIHTFIRYTSSERRVLDSLPVQRLRHIHQLALSYLVYPGATHRRFEHSLGVMDLAGRVFDIITRPDAVRPEIRDALPELDDGNKLRYWRHVLRLAALLHDVGHIPFSHAAEKEILPAGWDHERLTREVILSPVMQPVWDEMTPPIRPLDIVKLAIGPRKATDLHYSTWEAILYEIIGGDAFGVDRMDYLLRDSYHAGVAYGRFDHYRLVDSLRILPSPPTQERQEDGEPALGVDVGGLQSAEALLLARYLMYSQVYFHRVRLIYNIHLRDFLAEWLPGGGFPVDVQQHLRLTDNEVTAAIFDAAADPLKPGHDAAARIVERKHFRVVYERGPDDTADTGQAIWEAAKDEYGVEAIRHCSSRDASRVLDFPVLAHDDSIVSAAAMSETLRRIPASTADFVFVRPDIRDSARRLAGMIRMSIVKKGRM